MFKKDRSKFIVGILCLFVGSFVSPRLSHAGRFEVSMGGNFGRSDYGSGSFSWSRRYGGSFGYRYSELSAVEFSYQDVTDRTFIAGYQDTTFHDMIYSVDWTQSIFLRSFGFDPYYKLGVAQLNRDATGSYVNGATPTAQLDSLSGLIGFGLRLRLTPTFSIRAEMNSYLQGAKISTWRDNTGASLGSLFALSSFSSGSASLRGFGEFGFDTNPWQQARKLCF